MSRTINRLSETKKKHVNNTYEDCKEQIQKYCRYFARKHNAELSEVECEANQIFLECYMTCKTDKPFMNWLMYKMSRSLFDKFVRYPSFRSARLKRVYTEQEHGYEASFKLIDILDELSEDARYIVNIALDNPLDVALAASQRTKITPSAIKEAIKEFLNDLGWSISRIQSAFNEVTVALSR